MTKVIGIILLILNELRGIVVVYTILHHWRLL